MISTFDDQTKISQYIMSSFLKLSGIEASKSSEHADRSWWPCSWLTHVTNIRISFRWKPNGVTTCRGKWGGNYTCEAYTPDGPHDRQTVVNPFVRKTDRTSNVIDVKLARPGRFLLGRESRAATNLRKNQPVCLAISLFGRECFLSRYITPAFLFRHSLKS